MGRIGLPLESMNCIVTWVAGAKNMVINAKSSLKLQALSKLTSSWVDCLDSFGDPKDISSPSLRLQRKSITMEESTTRIQFTVEGNKLT